MKNELPPNFKNWNQLYTFLKERNLYHDGKMSIKIPHDAFKVYLSLEKINPHFYRLELDSDFLKFDSANPKVQVHKLPIWLEVVEIESDFNEKYFDRSLKQMAHWYFFTQIDGRE